MGFPEFVTSGLTRCQAITDLISSIANQETAIGHILNAEGEKVQAFVAAEATQDELLEVNTSVRRLVNALTRLESIMLAKLELFEECACVGCESEDDEEEED